MRNQGYIKALMRENERMGMKGNMENAADCVLVEPDRDWRRGRGVGVGKKSLQWSTLLDLPHYGHHLTLNPAWVRAEKRAIQQLELSLGYLEDLRADSNLPVGSCVPVLAR